MRGPLTINGLSEDRQCLVQCDNRDEIYSFHANGANFLFADGHVAFWNSSIEPRVLLSLITPKEGDNLREE